MRLAVSNTHKFEMAFFFKSNNILRFIIFCILVWINYLHKNKNMRLKFFLIIAFMQFSIYSQNKIIDSLKLLIQTPISDSLKVKVLGDLSWYYGSISIDSAFHYGDLALELSLKTNNKTGEAQAYNDLGILHYKQSNFETAIESYMSSLKIRKQLKDSLGIGSLYNKLGIAYQRTFQMDSALLYNTNALVIYEEFKHVKYIALIKNNIANIYFNLKQYNKSLNTHLEVAEMRKDINDNYGLVYSYTNIGNSYLYLNDTIQSILYYNRGIEIAEGNNYEQELSTLYNNYGAILKDKKNYSAAIKYFSKSLLIREKLKDNYGVASVELNIAELYLATNNIAAAESKIRRSLQLAIQMNANELEMNAYKSMLSYFAYKKNSDSVLYYQKLVSIAQDSIFNSRITKEVAEIQEKYNTAQNEKEIALQKEELLKKELEIKSKTIYSVILASGLIFFGIISFGLYKRSQHRKREYSNKLALKEAQTYGKLQNQRLNISRDLHDNIGSQLTFLISSIDNLKFLANKNDTILKTKLSEINQFATGTIGQLRDTIWAMNKNVISIEDLQSRVLSFIEKAKQVSNIKFRFNSSIESPIVFSSTKGIHIFRVIQESINNALKHANPTEISVLLSENQQFITIEIRDNGKGFDKNTVELGNGLENIQHRVQEIGAEITINSEIDKGTSIKITCDKNRSNDV